MRKRDTEREHILADKVFKESNIFDLQGLLLNKNYNFSAAIEAVYLNREERFREDFFTPEELNAKLTLAQKLNIPLFLIAHQEPDDFFRIFTVKTDNEQIVFSNMQIKSFEAFVNWWNELKGTPQTKQFRHEAQYRTQDSIIDILLRQNGLAWGGNIDGIIIEDDKTNNILGIVEKRISDESLSTYDPANYFYHRTDPLRNDYYTWKPLIKLALELDCPLYLLTFQKNNEQMYGYTCIKTIINGLQYWTGSPKNSLTTNPNAFNEFIKTERRKVTEQGFCFTCDKKISDEVRDFCLSYNNRKLFKGRVYCCEHQKIFKK